MLRFFLFGKQMKGSLSTAPPTARDSYGGTSTSPQADASPNALLLIPPTADPELINKRVDINSLRSVLKQKEFSA